MDIHYELQRMDRSLVDIYNLDYNRDNKFIPISLWENSLEIIALEGYLDKLQEALKKSYDFTRVFGREVKDKDFQEFISLLEDQMGRLDYLEDFKLEYKRLLDLLILEDLTDLYLEAYKNIYIVRYRRLGILSYHSSLSRDTGLKLVRKLKLMGNIKITEENKAQDGQIELEHKGLKCDLRLSTVPTVTGEKLAIRVLGKNKSLIHIGEYRFYEDSEFIKELLNYPYGLVLFCGPTGCGKSTSIYSILNYLNSPGKNIYTVEDPVEYRIAGLNQMEINPNLGLDFQTSLRAILRQDPDIISLGEIRDKATGQMALRAAMTGHLVFSSLHINNTLNFMDRFLEMGIDESLVYRNTNAVISQRLVNILCNNCKIGYKANEELKKVPRGSKIYRRNSRGCPYCSNGVVNRQAVFEVGRKLNGEFVLNTSSLEKRILNLIIDGQVEYEEIYKVGDPNS